MPARLSPVLSKEVRKPRPRRGAPEETRGRLVAAAAKLFNAGGYHGTDSNRIAEEAGYSPGTFYKHFKDKREIFLAAYDTWAMSEWEAVEREIFAGNSQETIARRLVTLTIDFHTRWRGLRSSLLELSFTDAEVRRFHRGKRRGQLDFMAKLRAGLGATVHPREEDAVLLLTMERCCDAIALGETRDLGLSQAAIVDVLTARMMQALI